jgi:hypothetical protein
MKVPHSLPSTQSIMKWRRAGPRLSQPHVEAQVLAKEL